ncbi:MAG TPA: FAD-dependent oxidoreductase, partial [Candidatus Eisenbacteria bacterium]|nr:FAD-dependent oxidoreductase [Candidatus Eisenbacteria bacterium]
MADTPATHAHDLVIIGSGPGGYVAAIRAAQLGLNVACVEEVPALGGTCLRIGCIPSKALLESSERYHEAKGALAAHGVKVGDVALDLPTMLGRKDKIVGELTRGVELLFKKNKVTRYQGHGRIAGPGRVTVTGEGGAVLAELSAKNILIATGSKPAALKGVAFDGDRIGTSTEALSYPEVPKHLVVIGAGYIGLELGSVWLRLGAKVTVLEYLDRILPGMDTELSTEAKRIFERQGMVFHLGRRVTGAKVVKNEIVVESEGA